MNRNKLIYIALILVIVIAGGIYLLNINIGGGRRYVRGEYIERMLSQAPSSLMVSGLDFKDGGIISATYTCDGENINPGFKWENIPTGTKSIAIIIYDIDAPKDYFIHWMIANIPPTTPGIPSDFEATDEVQGINDFGRMGYGGPCPPPGSKHKYFITVLALDTMLSLDNEFTFEEFYDSVKGHIIAYGQTHFYYQRG